ncbi:MAG: sulfotransferase domain-containing protein [Rhodovibrionaceae bacterium]
MGKLLWLASYPKSGNTWLRLFLLTLLRDPPAPLSINDVTKLTVADHRRSDYERLSGKSYEDLSWEEIARLRPRLHQELTTVHPNPVMIKTHAVLADHYGAPLITPQATAAAIYVVRNPLDIVASLANHAGMDLDQTIEFMAKEESLLGDGEKYLPSPVASWSTHVKSWTVRPHPQLLVLRYEDMAENAEETFTKVAQFLNLRRSPAQIRKAIDFTSFDNFKEQEQRDGFRERHKKSEQFFRKGKAGSWREELSPQQAERLWTRHQEEMRRFGYERPFSGADGAHKQA